MTDAALRLTARRAGIQVEWTGADGQRRRVAVPTLRAILAAMGEATRDGHEGERLVVHRGEELRVRTMERRAEILFENGAVRSIALLRRGTSGVATLTGPPGYHRLRLQKREVSFAIAPRHGWRLVDALGEKPAWGLAAQLYGLRRDGDGGIGDFTAAGQLAAEAAALGADALALSPTHALFPADPGRYGPYSPSHRQFLNPLYADPAVVLGPRAGALQLEPEDSLIDWRRAADAKWRQLRAAFHAIRERGLADPRSAPGASYRRFLREGGQSLADLACFDAIQARLAPDAWNWRGWTDWPSPSAPGLSAFRRENRGQIDFFLFAQWLAAESLRAAQAKARDAGMRIGLIADLAVGMDPTGAQAWSAQSDTLVGLTIGAPPDLFNPRGQNWGLTTYSPGALRRRFYAPFLSTLRGTLRNTGGVRIDHAMGLARLWLIPEGMAPSDGAYVTYPLGDLLRLLALESARAKAVVVAEDLGTVPPGFCERLARAGVAGMRVLWFERDRKRFRQPAAWRPEAVALTSTHDLPTVAGWWRGADLRALAGVGHLDRKAFRDAQAKRGADRKALWQAFRRARLVGPDVPGAASSARAVSAALRFVGRSASRLALIPLEDALGQVEQPNLPGTIEEHPNWRRRLAQPVDRILRQPAVRRRLQGLRPGGKEGA